MMEITANDKFYEVRFDFNARIISDLRNIRGAHWRGDVKAWFVPLYREEDMTRFRQKYGVLDPNSEINAIAEMTDDIPPLPELKITIPLKRNLFAYQEYGVAYNLEKLKTIIGDQMGIGKTFQSIASVFARDAFPCLVICQSSKKLDWQEEWKMNVGMEAMILRTSIKESWPQYYKVANRKVFITNFESLKKYFVEKINVDEGESFKLKDIVFKESILLFKSVIIDESHKVKDGRTQQAKFCMGITRQAEQVHLLTGTAVVNNPKDLISQLLMIRGLSKVVAHLPMTQDGKGKYDHSGYNRFIARYCAGGRGASNLKELNYRLNLVGYYRRNKADVLKDLPPKIRQFVRCEITNRREYDKAENDFVQYLQQWKGCTDVQIRRKLRAKILVQMGILKGISAHGKIEALSDYLDECAEANEKVIVFCYLRDVITVIKEKYPDGTLLIHGDVKEEDRQAAVRAFNTQPTFPRIVCNYKSGGTGLNLPAAQHVAFIELPWTFADCEQCEDRAHRIGVQFPVNVPYFIGNNTIDEYCYELIQDKKFMGLTVTGGEDDIPTEMVDKLYDLFSKPKKQIS